MSKHATEGLFNTHSHRCDKCGVMLPQFSVGVVYEQCVCTEPDQRELCSDCLDKEQEEPILTPESCGVEAY